MHHIDPAEAATEIGADDQINDTGLEMLGWMLLGLVGLIVAIATATLIGWLL